MKQRWPRAWMPEALAHGRPGVLRAVHVRGPSAPSVPPFAGPPITYTRGPHHFELVTGEGPAQPITELLTIRS
jgi:hypothetical protein